MALGDESRSFGQILEFVEANSGMRHEHLRVFLEIGGDDNERDVLFDGVESLEQARGHVEVEFARGEQDRVGGLGTALNDFNVEAVFGIGSIRDRLIESAVFGFGEPVGAKAHLVRRRR